MISCSFQAPDTESFNFTNAGKWRYFCVEHEKNEVGVVCAHVRHICDAEILIQEVEKVSKGANHVIVGVYVTQHSNRMLCYG